MAVVDESTVSIRPPAPVDMIDAARYTDEQFAALEHERLWATVWQVACLVSELPNVGDRTTYDVGPRSVLIVRTDDGALAAYANVCRHRGRRLEDGPGCSAQVRCPYHGWTWALDGRISEIPERETFAPFDDADVALATVRLDTWHDYVFVTFDQDAPPLSEFLGDLPRELAPYHFERQYRWFNKRTTVAANWKNTVEAFLEAYHARMIHPESNLFLDYKDYPVELIGPHSKMIIPTGLSDRYAVEGAPDFEETLAAMEFSFGAFGEDTTAVEVLRQMKLEDGQQLRDLLIPVFRQGMDMAGIDVSELSDGQVVDDWHYFIFPNIVINSFSFGYWLFRMLPGDDVDHTLVDMWYFHRVPEAAELPPPEPQVLVPEGESCGVVMDQDFRNIPQQQRGMKNPTFRGPRLSSLESRISHLHDVLDTYIKP